MPAEEKSEESIPSPHLPHSIPPDSQAEIERRRLVEALRRSRVKTRELYQISRSLNAGQTEQELLEVLARPALERGAFRAVLMYVTADDLGKPEWLKVGATVMAGEGVRPETGTIYPLVDLPFTHIWTASPNRPQLIQDVTCDDRVNPQAIPLYQQWGVQAIALLPLLYAGQWVGLITFDWREPHTFSEDERGIYITLIGLAGPAVNSRRLLVEQERALVDKLYRISRGLNTARDKDELLAVFGETMMKPWGISHLTLGRILTDQENQPLWLEFVAARSATERLPFLPPQLHLQDHPGTQLWLDQPNRTLFIPNTRLEKRFSPSGQARLAQSNVAALVVVTLKQANRWVGVLFFGWPEPHVFSELEQEIFNALPALVTPAVDNLWFMEILEQLVSERTARLQESEERLHQVAEGTRDLIAQVDLEGRFTYLNPPAEKILGLKVENALGLALPDFVHPEDKERTEKVFTGWLKSFSSQVTFENRLVNRRTGQVYHMDWSINLHRSPTGHPTHLSAIAHDITARKKSEEAIRLVNAELQQRLEDLATLNRITQTLATLTDLQAALEFVAWEMIATFRGGSALVSLLEEASPNLTVVTHYNPASGDNLKGYRYPVAAHPLSAEVIRTGRTVIIKDAQNSSWLIPDPEMAQARNIYSLVGLPLLARGEIVGLIMISLDTPDRAFTADEIKLAETITGQVAGAIANARLFEEEKRQRQISDSLREVATILNSSLKLEEVLDKILAQLGHIIRADSASILVIEGSDLVTLAGVDPNRRVPLSRNTPHGRVFKQRKPLIIDNVLSDPDWLASPAMARIRSWMGSPLLVGEKVMGVLAVNNYQQGQYTEKDAQILQIFATQAAIALENARLFEEAARSREAAEIANRAKSTFLATMSHEFRTPLNGILGYTQLLQRESRLTEQQQEAAAVIEQSGEHLLTLINDILDLSQIEAGKLELHPIDLYLPGFLQKMGNMVQGWAERKGVIFVLKAGPLPLYVRGDERRLRQVLINLLGNAIKFTFEGTVTFSVTKVEKSAQESQLLPPKVHRLRFEVEDTGIGIASENLERIFELFQQARSNIQPGHGTGLGLAICRNLVELMGGKLQVKSTPGKGSLFWFELLLPEIRNSRAGTSPGSLESHPTPRGISLGQNTRNSNLIVPPSTSDLATLLHLVHIGDVRAIQHYAGQLKEADKQLVPFAAELERMAKNFQLEALQAWLRSYQGKAGSSLMGAQDPSGLVDMGKKD